MSLLVYKSSAGSGKTFTLIIEYLALALKAPNSFKNIIALTFTIKATLEMKDRLISTLVKLKDMDIEHPEPKLLDLINPLSERIGFDNAMLKANAGALLKNILHHYGELGFSTLDSFVVRIVRSFSHDLHLSANFDIELDQNILIEEAIERVYEQVGIDQELTQFLIDYTINKLEEEHSYDLQIPLSNLGKLIFESKHYVNIDSLKTIPLTNFVLIKNLAQSKLKEYDRNMKQFGVEGLKILNDFSLNPKSCSRAWLHNYFSKLYKLHEHCYKLDELENKTFLEYVEDNKQWYTKNQSKDIIDRIEQAIPSLSAAIQRARTYYTEEIVLYNSYSLILKHITPLALLHELKRAIINYSEENDLVHLSEVNRKIAEIVNEQHAPFIYERIGQKYKHFLIDEFQDTSVIQWNNIIPLVENSLASGYKNLLVGDAKQSIYRWRDAEVEQFVRLPLLANTEQSNLQKIREKLFTQVYQAQFLNTNYRSKENIVYFNNTFFSRLLQDETPYVLNFFENHTQLASKDPFGGYVNIQLVDGNTEAVIEAIYQQILTIEKAQQYSLGDICIIARKNKILSQIADFLLQKGIKVVSADALYLYKSQTVNLIISMMYILQESNVSLHSYVVIRYINQYLPLNNETTFLTSKSFFNFLNAKGFDFELEKMLQLDSYQLAEYLIDKAKLPNPINPFLFHLLDLMIEQGKKTGNSSGQFLKYWETNYESLKINLAHDPHAVQLLSIHKSKGLEFPIVIFPYFRSRKSTFTPNYLWDEPMESIKTFIPKVLISDEAKGLQSVFKDTIQLEFDRQRLDELNMLYVTCTRATDQLYLLLSKKEENEKMWLNIKSIDWEPTRLITQSDDKLSIGQIESKASNMPIEVQKLAPNLLIDQYIYQPWNNRIRLKREQNAVNGIAELRDKGVQLHALLNNFEQNKSIKKLIEQSIAANEMAAENALEFQTILLELSTNKQYNFLFETSATHKTEKELITANGQAMRPDKVIIYADHCLVVDYKYANYQEISEREKQKHQQQVQGYMEQIQLIENKSCKGYLLYLHPRIDLVEVKY